MIVAPGFFMESFVLGNFTDNYFLPVLNGRDALLRGGGLHA